MNKIKEFINSTYYKETFYPEVKRIVAVIFFTFIYGIGVEWFLEQSVVPMYTGGVPGLGQVLRDLLIKMNILSWDGEQTFRALFSIIANVPLILLAWFGVSKRFAIYSLLSVLMQATVIGIIPSIDLGIGQVEHALLASILGGLLIGVGVGGALKYGTSTGGVDIIAQYLSLNKGSSVGFISLVLNLSIAISGALISGGRAEGGVFIGAGLILAYTMVRLIVTTISMDKVHTAYHYLSMEIITENPLAITELIIYKMGRGVTLSKVSGAFSDQEKTKIMVVISNYELQNLIDIIESVDEKAFVISRPVRNVHGNFKRKRIA